MCGECVGSYKKSPGHTSRASCGTTKRNMLPFLRQYGRQCAGHISCRYENHIWSTHSLAHVVYVRTRRDRLEATCVTSFPRLGFSHPLTPLKQGLRL